MAVSFHAEGDGDAEANTTLTEEEARELSDALADGDAAAKVGDVGAKEVTTPGTMVDSPVVAPSMAVRHRSARLVASAAKLVETTGPGAGSRLAQHTAASAAKVKGPRAAAVTQPTPSGPPTAGDKKRKSPIDFNQPAGQSKRQKPAPAPKATATATPKSKQPTPKPSARGKK
jgi:hypothetical protein